jgi:hypothetical protein
MGSDLIHVEELDDRDRLPVNGLQGVAAAATRTEAGRVRSLLGAHPGQARREHAANLN